MNKNYIIEFKNGIKIDTIGVDKAAVEKTVNNNHWCQEQYRKGNPVVSIYRVFSGVPVNE